MPVFNNRGTLAQPTQTRCQEQIWIALWREHSISIEQFSQLLGQLKLSVGCFEIKISCLVAKHDWICFGIICTVPICNLFPPLLGLFFFICFFFLIMHPPLLGLSAFVNCCLGFMGKKSQELLRPHKQNKQPLDSDSYTQTTSKYKLPSH